MEFVDDEVLDTKQLAKLLKKHIRTVRRLLKDGRLPGARVGRGYRISRAALEEFLKGNYHPTK